MKVSDNILTISTLKDMCSPNLHVGVFGGSFNPMHEGHVMVAKWAMEELFLDRLLFVVARVNMFKPQYKKSVLERAKYAVDFIKQDKNYNEKMFVSSIEEEINSNCTHDLISYLKNQFPSIKLTFIIGADCAEKFHLWDNYQDILKMSDVAIFDRSNYTDSALNSVLVQEYGVKLFTGRYCNISSTEIRERFNNNDW